MRDAESLLSLSRALRNERKYRMRAELRQKLGEALRVPVKRRDQLDVAESGDLFVVLKPGSAVRRHDLADCSALLRQAVVAACAALETFVADKAMTRVGPSIRAGEPPQRLLQVPLSVGQWLEIERRYERRGWGVRQAVEEYVRDLSSVAPSQLGQVLSTVGVQNWARQVDDARGVRRGTTVKQLKEISDRRNRIAHSGDRQGQGRARIEPGEVERYLRIVREVAGALDQLLRQKPR